MRLGRGFSLVELLITVGVVAIVSAMVFPSFNHVWNQSSEQVSSAQLLRAISLARSEAILRVEDVVFEWQQGWTVRSSSRVLYTFAQPSKNGELHWRAFPKNQQQLIFLPSGQLDAENGTFWYCSKPSSKSPSWAVVLNQFGRARIVYPDEKNQIIDDKGHLLLC